MLKAYHNDPAIKEVLINQLQAHYDADEIIKGTYWQDGKGCAVGCSIHSSDHSLYEKELGLPEWIARVEDRIFEGLPNHLSKEWPLRISKAVKIGSNIDKIKIPFLILVVESVLDKFDHEKFPECKISIENLLHLLKTNPENSEADSRAAASAAAWAAAEAARAAWAAEAAEADSRAAARADACAAAEADAWADACAAAEASTEADAWAAAGAASCAAEAAAAAVAGAAAEAASWPAAEVDA